MYVLRIIGSLILACVVVFAMLATGLGVYGAFDDEEGRIVHPVSLLSTMERLRMAVALGEDGDRRPHLPELPADDVALGAGQFAPTGSDP